MERNPIPENEEQRLETLHSLNILDSEAEAEFDAITSMVSQMIDVPMSLITLVDKERQWFKSKVGIDVEETPREISFCQYAIMQDAVYEVNNALENELFKDNPFVAGEGNVRFYAGAPLKTTDGHNLGTLCVVDTKPRELSDEQREILREYAKEVVRLIERHKN